MASFKSVTKALLGSAASCDCRAGRSESSVSIPGIADRLFVFLRVGVV